MRWPWSKPERRSSAGGAFTAAVTAALMDLAEGGDLFQVEATAALETCAGIWARAFASAKVEPEGDVRAEAVTSAVLGTIGRELIRTGESMHLIEVDGGAVRLRLAGSWDVRGGPDEGGWSVRLDLFAPSTTTSRMVPYSAVVHPRYSVDPVRPWLGVGPMGWARATGKLTASLERRLASEAGAPVGHVLPIPDEGEDGALDGLRADMAKADGGTLLVETTSAGWGEGKGAAPAQDWTPKRFGANPPAVLHEIRTAVQTSVAAATGVPPVLVTGRGDGTAMREAWRQFLHGGISPVARLVEDELSDKLDTEIRLGFDDLKASDLAGRARAFQSMVGGGMDVEKAAALAGLMAE